MKITREQLKHIVRETMIEENEYQTFFKKALEKTGKSIPQMSDEEKKTFFNKIDAAWNGKGEKNEDLVGNQKKLDIDGDGKIDASDLAALRAGKKKTERFGRGVKGPTFGSANESVNENVALNRLNSVQATREKMISYISHKMANGLRKPDSWYDKKEKTLSNKSYKDLEKIYLKLGGVKESVNEDANPKFFPSGKKEWAKSATFFNADKVDILLITSKYKDVNDAYYIFKKDGRFIGSAASIKGGKPSDTKVNVKLSDVSNAKSIGDLKKMIGESINEEIKVGSSVTVNYPTLKKPVMGKVNIS